MRCKVCGKRIKLSKSRKYLVIENKGVIDFSAKVVYEAFDCQACGCQNIVNIRENNKIEEKVEQKLKAGVKNEQSQ